jgi:hypothetical protein
VTVEVAAAMGFRRQEVETSLAILEAMAVPESLDVAMDLARFVRVPLVDATYALVTPKRLRRLGLPVPTDSDIPEVIAIVRPVVAGQAAAYAKTWYGQSEVREAQGWTLGQNFELAMRAIVDRVFGRNG